jgi:saccharopepsin
MRSHFVAKIGVGKDKSVQKLDVVFDTSSGQTILPDANCHDQACEQRTKYSYSKTGGDRVPKAQFGDEMIEHVDAELDMVDFALGKTTSYFAKDNICFGSTMDYGGADAETCIHTHLMAATRMSDKPYSQLPYDGVIGLGMNGLSINNAFNFIARWTDAAEGNTESCKAQGYAHQFAFFFPPSREGQGELAIGGYVSSRLASPLVWVPVDKPNDGFWMIRLSAIKVGDKTLEDACPGGECWGLIDTSSSRLGVPANMHSKLNSELALSTPKDGDCRSAKGKDLRLVLGDASDSFSAGDGDAELVLGSSDYGVLAMDKCVPELVPLRAMPRENVYVFGEAVLRRYYTVFDWEKKRIGFGLAAQDSQVDVNAAPEAPTCKAK